MMRAMVLKKQRAQLILEEVPKPTPKEDELLIKVHTCGVCRTDLHVRDGDLAYPKLPLILGHEIVGTVEEMGKQVQGFHLGERVGVPWLSGCCGVCEFCTNGQENLCEKAIYTGYQVNGGFAEYTVCKAPFAIALPSSLDDAHMAPLLCAGLIGYRAYKMANPKKTLGIYGFGAAAHLITQLAVFEGKEVYAFTQPGDDKKQAFAKKLGAAWAGDSTASPPTLLDAVIIFAPVGRLVPEALKHLKKGGVCICGGIYMSDIPSFPYKDLWEEKSIRSVANLTREDAHEFFAAISKFPIQTSIRLYPLEEANQALDDLKAGKFEGAAVLKVNDR
jgi:propanol-preferring alcohol dehydrogenase